MNFQLIRHRVSDRWVPPTDIDGVDAQEDVLEDVNNIDFENGFITNANGTGNHSIPTVVSNELDSYELLDAKDFNHSTRGLNTVYILYKVESEVHSLKIYVNSTLLNLDEQNNNLTILNKPSKINYNLVNDQLKINLNCMGRYEDLPVGDVILNLTLVYLESVKYSDTVSRNAGWYCFPRWLGWSYPGSFNNKVQNYGTLSETEFPDDLLYWFVEEGITASTTLIAEEMFGWERVDTGSDDDISLSSAAPPNDNGIRISPAGTGLMEIEFTAKKIGTAASIALYLSDFDGTRGRHLKSFQLTDNWVTYSYDYNQLYGTIDYGKPIWIVFYYAINPFGADPDSRGYIDNIRLTIQELEATLLTGIIIAKYFDGQRALIDKLGNSDLTLIGINKNAIDWRVQSYEVYFKKDGLFILRQIWDVDGSWVEDGDYITKSGYRTPFGVNTLNFNYNLPEDTRVDNQKIIWSEVYHKGRVYFVNGDYKVYQSHILPNLAIQADSFPYDEEVGFGFFIVSQDKVNTGLAVSMTEDLIVYTGSQGMYIYYIQPSGNSVYRKLRKMSGAIGLASLNSLTKSLNGDPATEGLFWIDYNGIYFYGGGVSTPDNLILGTHENYWKGISNTDKENAVGFFNPVSREYWLSIGSDILIYELMYKKLRKYNGAYFPQIDGYVGLRNNRVYYRSGNNIKIIGFNYSSANFTTHYRSGDVVVGTQRVVLPENADKILQELYIIFGQSDITDVVMYVYVDNWLMGSRIFNTGRVDKWLSDLGVRFGKIKFKIVIPAGKKVRISEFGCSYVLDSKEPLGNIYYEDLGAGFGSEFGTEFGQT